MQCHFNNTKGQPMKKYIFSFLILLAIALWIKSDDLTKQISDFLNRQTINEYEAFKQNALSCTKTHNKESCKKLIAMAKKQKKTSKRQTNIFS